MRHPKEPILFLVAINGRDVAAVRAMSGPEARDWFVENMVAVTRPTPTQAFRLGEFGEVEIHNAKPEYAEPGDDEDPQQPLFGAIVGDGPLAGPQHGVPIPSAYDGLGELSNHRKDPA